VIDIWCTPIHIDEVSSKTSGSVAAKKRLTTVQRASTIAITGALRTSPTDTLDACAFTILATQLIKKWCFKAVMRLATIPPEHPLFKLVRTSTNCNVIKHKSPLHNLMHIFKLDPLTTSKVMLAVRNPMDHSRLPLQISIANNKEESIIEAANATETIKVFSDRSEINDKVGAAALLLRPGKPQRTLHYHLGSNAKHTVQEVELVGLLLGIHLIKTETAGKTSCAVGTDNQAAIKTLATDLIQPSQKVALKVLRTTATTQKQRNSNNNLLTIHWTAGHSGIEGNEKADIEAKAAASCTTSDKKSLLPFLCRTLTANPSALKRKHHKTLMETWAKT
jgi:ribonuclease HI